MIIKITPAKGNPIVINFDWVISMFRSDDGRILYLQMGNSIMSNLGVITPTIEITGVWKLSAEWMEKDIVEGVKNNVRFIEFTKERVASYQTKYYEPF
ncbi:hypothetical protein [Phocaeicola plebeius]|uniref:hypothetical protein n=1 Tax=Phocaeicola plebeius TaxID=310297 RepID=UPI003FD7D689